jgi:hypothetical protein
MLRRVCKFNQRHTLHKTVAPTRELAAMQYRDLVVAMLAAVAGFVVAASAQAGGVTPAKGQSPEQQQKDISECQAAATQATGFNPSAPPPPAAEADAKAGGRVKGAAKGAAVGAVVAGAQGGDVYDNASDDAKKEYRQNQAQSTAQAGAMVAASKQRQDRRDTRKDEKQQAEDLKAKTAAYDQSYQGCLTGRGYTVTP